MSKDELVSFLEERNLVLVDKNALEEFTINARLASQVDKRVLWINKKTAIAKYKVTSYWLTLAEKDPFSYLQVSKGSGKTSTKKYLESSIIDEQQRQAEC